MLWAPSRAKRRTPAESGAQQLVDLSARIGGGHAVRELDLDEPHEERVKRSASCEELLGDLREGPAGCDHAGERGNLTASALDVPYGGVAIRVVERTHGETNAAPVIPAAA